MLFRNGMVYTMEFPGDLLDFRVKDGKFAQIGKNLKPEENEEIIDIKGMNVYPGMVESHCHLGLHNSSIGYEGWDYNEKGTDPVTPQMRGIDGINVLDETVIEARQAGVTTVCSGPGSANAIGGTFCIWKTDGHCIDDMVIVNPAAMKAAFGENPKRVYQDKGINSRMGTTSRIRQMLSETKEYMEKKEKADEEHQPAWNAKYEAMIPVLKKEIPLKCHAHQHDDICTAIRIGKEFDINITLDHCTDGALIPDVIKRSGYPALIGPSLGHKSKHELANKSFETCKAMYDNGILFSIITDSPVIPQKYLPLCGQLAMKAGLPKEEAYKAITINPARILGIENRVGSIAPGKDADFIICKEDLLEADKDHPIVYINGCRCD